MGALAQTRTRWAAIGAAIAVALGGGGLGVVRATTGSGERAVYLAIEPCRLVDTRAGEFNVGPRSVPLGADETFTTAGWGANGDCALPSGTAALALNVTAVGATAPTFLTLFPAGTDLPIASHLNPLPNAGPAPNAVNVTLDDTGQFSVYNFAGRVDVIIDVVGLFDDHHHDDRYYRKDEVLSTSEVYTKAEVDAAIASAVAAASPIVMDRTVSAGTERVLLSKPGLTVKGNCTASLAQVKFDPVPSGSVWFFGTKSDEDDPNLSVKFESQTSYWEADDQFMHIDGLLYVSTASPRYYQINVQARRSAGGSCLFWVQMSPATFVQ
jgi:hypothetical protein